LAASFFVCNDEVICILEGLTQFVPHTLFCMYFIIIQSTSARPVSLFSLLLFPLHQYFRNCLSRFPVLPQCVLHSSPTLLLDR